MTITGGNSIYEQARDEGGIIDMLAKDMKETDKQLGKKSGAVPNKLAKRRQLLNRIGNDVKTLKKMSP